MSTRRSARVVASAASRPAPSPSPPPRASGRKRASSSSAQPRAKKAKTSSSSSSSSSSSKTLPGPGACGRRFWLVKSEPEDYSIDDLKRDVREPWDGVRNYTARNHMRDLFSQGDMCLFYHSSCKVPSVVGVAKVVSDAYPDPKQFDPKAGKYYDPKSDRDAPRWLCVDVEYVRHVPEPVSLHRMKEDKEGALKDFCLWRWGRLSVAPVTEEHFRYVLGLAGAADDTEGIEAASK